MIAGNSKICICVILIEQTGPRKIKRLRPIETGFGHPGRWSEPHQRISSVNRGEQVAAAGSMQFFREQRECRRRRRKEEDETCRGTTWRCPR